MAARAYLCSMFRLHRPFPPAGDQPGAIKELVHGLESGERFQTLLGVTGSGKTYTMANVIESVQRPTLVLTHNKTLVAQLYGEFRQFFPENAVEYFVSYYDYFQPEAYLPSSNTYIEKDLSINEELEKLRLRATSSLLTGRRDVLVVASVSCIYGIGNPSEYAKSIIRVRRGDKISRQVFLRRLVDALYKRSQGEWERGSFRVKGSTVDIHLPYLDYGYRFQFFGDEIEEIEQFDPLSGKRIQPMEHAAIFPANLYLAPKDLLPLIMEEIRAEMEEQVKYFLSQDKKLEAQRIRDRVNYDLEMIQELGYCSGIENYSRFLDRRNPGDRPFCLLDYFPEDFLLIVDESHVTIPQIGGMYGGDRSRKLNLVEYGFRLPSALDNRPLHFQEFSSLIPQAIFVSATPGQFELDLCQGVIVEQIVRPTGLLDPPIEQRPSENQIDDLLDEIDQRVKVGERVLITTLTKKMAEELNQYLQQLEIRSQYIHSEVDTLERIEILRSLRLGEIDVLVGVNLLREGLDLPEVSLIAILDADKEGFLRNERSLTQMAGRAARNINGKVIFYADRTTESMRRTMDETQRRRAIQMAFNEAHGIVPQTVSKSREEIFHQTSVLDILEKAEYAADGKKPILKEADAGYQSPEEIRKQIRQTRKAMEKAAQDYEFMEAARLRDLLFTLEKALADQQ